MLEVRAKERRDIRSGLGNNEMIHVEELCDAGEGAIAIGVVGLAPGTEGDFLGGGPGDDGAGFVFAFEDYGEVEGCGGGVGGEGGRPDELGGGGRVSGKVSY